VEHHRRHPAAGSDVVNTKKRKLSPVATSVLVGAGALVVLLIGMFALVLPQKHTAAKLAKDIETTQTQIVQARALAEQKPAQPIRVADLFKLVKAMPDTADMTGIMLQLNQTASDAGIEFETISPQPAELIGDYQRVGISVMFNGNYYALTDFLFRLRNLVSVRGGALVATGRMFSVQSITFGEGDGGFPSISATLTLQAFVYGTKVAGSAPPPPTPTATDGTATTPAPTGSTETPPPTDSPAPVASGVTN
jgi:hypothetical protein